MKAVVLDDQCNLISSQMNIDLKKISNVKEKIHKNIQI